MKKVLIVLYNNLNKGGIQSVIMDIVRQLHDDFVFDVICFEDAPAFYDDEFGSYGGKIFKYQINSSHIHFFQRLNFYIRFPQIVGIVSNIIKQRGPYDVIHCNNAIESGLCLYVAKKNKIPVRLAHSHVAFNNEENFVRQLYDKVYRKMIIKNATHLIGCSKKAANNLFGNNIGKVICNGVELNRFNPNLFHEQLSLSSLSIVQVATYSENKNQLFSLVVFKSIVERYPNSKLTFVGRCVDGDSQKYYETIIAFVKQKGLENKVQFLPSDFDIPMLLSKTNYLIFPSLSEGFGIVPVEAQAMGVRCFVSDTVPNETNCGGCTYLSLSLGEKKWSEIIIEDYERTKGVHGDFDCSRFEAKTVAEEFRRIYEGKGMV